MHVSPRSLALAAWLSSVALGCGTESSADTSTPETTSPDAGSTPSIAHADTHERAADYVWDDADIVDITLQGNAATVANDAAGAVTVSGATVTIGAGGTYRLTDATLFSKADLTIYGAGGGSGTLTVDSHYNDGIGSKDGLVLRSARITVRAAADDGIRGKDYLVIEDSTLDVTATADGLKSDNEDDGALGYVQIQGGSITVTSGNDALQAETDLLIESGSFALTTGGGSGATLATDVSAKALKGVLSVVVLGGSFQIDSADDAIHSNDTVLVEGGTFAIRTGDDGVHADVALTLRDGSVTIRDAYEGLESASIAIEGGALHATTRDDGINAADGTSATTGAPGAATVGTNTLAIEGGYVYVDAAGDGLDVNGSMTMRGGTVLVNGPTANDNGALDYDGTCVISGGVLVAAGSAGMAMAPSTTSTQRSLMVRYGSATTGAGGRPGMAGAGASLAAGTLLHLEATDGSDLLTFAPTKAYQSVVFSAPSLQDGLEGSLYTGGSCTGAMRDGLTSDAVCSGGTLESTFSIAGSVTTTTFQ